MATCFCYLPHWAREAAILAFDSASALTILQVEHSAPLWLLLCLQSFLQLAIYHLHLEVSLDSLDCQEAEMH